MNRTSRRLPPDWAPPVVSIYGGGGSSPSLAKRGRREGGLCRVGLLHIDKEFIFVLGDWERGCFGSRDRLEKCCRRGHCYRSRLDRLGSRLESGKGVCRAVEVRGTFLLLSGSHLLGSPFTVFGRYTAILVVGFEIRQKVVGPLANPGLSIGQSLCLGRLASLRLSRTRLRSPARPSLSSRKGPSVTLIQCWSSSALSLVNNPNEPNTATPAFETHNHVRCWPCLSPCFLPKVRLRRHVFQQ